MSVNIAAEQVMTAPIPAPAAYGMVNGKAF